MANTISKPQLLVLLVFCPRKNVYILCVLVSPRGLQQLWGSAVAESL